MYGVFFFVIMGSRRCSLGFHCHLHGVSRDGSEEHLDW